MSYIRIKENQEKHDKTVATWANKMISAGWETVLSDLPGNKKPATIRGYIPDIYAAHGIEEYIIEVETEDSANTQHALEQKAIFQSWANASPNRKFTIRIA